MATVTVEESTMNQVRNDTLDQNIQDSSLTEYITRIVNESTPEEINCLYRTYNFLINSTEQTENNTYLTQIELETLHHVFLKIKLILTKETYKIEGKMEAILSTNTN